MKKITYFTTGIRSTLLIEHYKKWLKKNDNVLDVGCGDGILSTIIASNCGIKLTGCDVKNYLQTDVRFVQMHDASSLPFPNKSFDKIMFNDVFHHMSYENQERLLKEAVRVSKKILIFEVEPTIIGSLADTIINKFHSLTMPTPLTFRKHTQWIKLFKKIGVRYEFHAVRKPLLYPFTHEAFYLYR